MATTPCAHCGHQLAANEDRCPQCGSGDRIVNVEDSVTLSEARLHLQARHGAPGEVRPHAEVSDEVKWNADRERFERRHIVVDRENNGYSQTWYDLDTGEIAWQKSGALDDPEMHGLSARRPTPSSGQPEQD